MAAAREVAPARQLYLEYRAPPDTSLRVSAARVHPLSGWPSGVSDAASDALLPFAAVPPFAKYVVRSRRCAHAGKTQSLTQAEKAAATALDEVATALRAGGGQGGGGGGSYPVSSVGAGNGSDWIEHLALHAAIVPKVLARAVAKAERMNALAFPARDDGAPAGGRPFTDLPKGWTKVKRWYVSPGGSKVATQKAMKARIRAAAGGRPAPPRRRRRGAAASPPTSVSDSSSDGGWSGNSTSS